MKKFAAILISLSSTGMDDAQGKLQLIGRLRGPDRSFVPYSLWYLPEEYRRKLAGN
jgi:hypothetical protein